jgi:hypothetical protein
MWNLATGWLKIQNSFFKRDSHCPRVENSERIWWRVDMHFQWKQCRMFVGLIGGKVWGKDIIFKLELEKEE